MDLEKIEELWKILSSIEVFGRFCHKVVTVAFLHILSLCCIKCVSWRQWARLVLIITKAKHWLRWSLTIIRYDCIFHGVWQWSGMILCWGEVAAISTKICTGGQKLDIKKTGLSVQACLQILCAPSTVCSEGVYCAVHCYAPFLHYKKLIRSRVHPGGLLKLWNDNKWKSLFAGTSRAGQRNFLLIAAVSYCQSRRKI